MTRHRWHLLLLWLAASAVLSASLRMMDAFSGCTPMTAQSR